MTALEAVEAVLKQAGEPLHYREITQRALDQGLWQTAGKTPWDTVNARLAVDIKEHGQASRFQRVAKGVFTLRSPGAPVLTAAPGQPTTPPSAAGSGSTGPPDGAKQSHDRPQEHPANKTLSFTDAAERVLQRYGNSKPMHYRDITAKALELGLINTVGKTPEATLYAVILTEIERDRRRGQTPRFVKHGKGLVGLSSWQPRSIAAQIEQHNRRVRTLLLERLKAMPPADFEELIGNVLGELGFEQISRTSYSRDGGIDVRGTMVVAGVVRTTMAVQAKRWKNNVPAPVVQQVRGSLGTHEQGLIITTGNFSKGARAEAAQPNKVPIALMNGEQLVDLLIEHGIGVKRETYHLLSLPIDLQVSPASATPGASVVLVVHDPDEDSPT